jgi:hypothetical protein
MDVARRDVFCRCLRERGTEVRHSTCDLVLPINHPFDRRGWALGIGRLGGIGGPLLFELLLSLHLTPSGALYASAIPMPVSGTWLDT